MSRKNLETVRAGYEAFNRGDFDSATAACHPEAEWHVLAELPDAQVYRGRDEIIRFFKMWRDAFEGFQAEIDRIVDTGDRIVVFLTVSGSGRGSAAEVELVPTVVDACETFVGAGAGVFGADTGVDPLGQT